VSGVTGNAPTTTVMVTAYWALTNATNKQSKEGTTKMKSGDLLYESPDKQRQRAVRLAGSWACGASHRTPQLADTDMNFKLKPIEEITPAQVAAAMARNAAKLEELSASNRSKQNLRNRNRRTHKSKRR
jgi:hypothetical protein